MLEARRAPRRDPSRDPGRLRGSPGSPGASRALMARGSVPWEKARHSGTRLTWPLASSSRAAATSAS